MRKNYASPLPARMLFIDTETTRHDEIELGMQVFRLGVSCFIKADWGNINASREVWREHMTPDTLLDEMDARSYNATSLNVYGSNISFDIAALRAVEFFTHRKWELKVFHEKGLSFILIIKNGKRTIKFLSMQNFIPTSIAKLGRSLGYEKDVIDYDTNNQIELLKYCRKDVDILKKGMLNWYMYLHDNDLGGAAITLPSQAFRAFRHRFMKHKILIYGDKDINKYERRAFHGGRCECFKIGSFGVGDYVQVDINSMYPFVMQNYSYPARKLGYIEYNNMGMLAKCLKNGCATALVFIDTDEPVYCKRINDRACFPVGKFWVHLNTRALAYAFEHDHIKKIYNGIYYQSQPLFKEYIKCFYAKRKNYRLKNNTPYDVITKLFMNSLYGKFVEQWDVKLVDEHTDSDEYSITEFYDGVTGEYGTERVFFHRRQVLSGKIDGSNAFPAIAGHISEDSRLHLWKYIRLVGLENCFYCDTDSLIITRKVYDDNLARYHSDGLGDLKIEATGTTLDIFNLKDYKIGDKRVLKGVQEIRTLNGTETYHSLHSYGLGTLMRKNITAGAVLRPVELSLKRKYIKGKVGLNGVVRPFYVDEDDSCPSHELLPPY